MLEELRVISKEIWETPKKGGLVFKGSGDLNWKCGKCGTVLLEGVKRGELRDKVFRCSKCGEHNVIP